MSQKGLRDHPGHTYYWTTYPRLQMACEHHVGPLLGAGENTQKQGLKTELGLESWAQAEGCSQGCPWEGCF